MYSYHSSNYCNSNTWHSFQQRSKKTKIANASESKKEQQLLVLIILNIAIVGKEAAEVIAPHKVIALIGDKKS